MEQYDRNFKVQQLMGSKLDLPSISPSSAKHNSSSVSIPKRR